MNYYPRHIGDYVKDTSHLTLLEHGVYVRLLDIYYDREGALPTQCEGNANAMLHRLVGARNDDERRAVDDILAEFFVLKDGAWHNKRANKEIEKNAERARKASESASKRWGKCEGNANAMPTQCEGNANQKPKAKSQKINTPPTPPGGFEEGFALWVAYRKSRKLKAYVQDTWDAKFEEYQGRPLEFLRDVKYSIGQGYQGIYAPKNPPPTPSRGEVFRSVAEVLADG